MTSLVTDSVKSLSDLVHYSRRLLPNTPDGLTDVEAASATANRPLDHGKLYNLIQSIEDDIKRGPPVDPDASTMIAILDAIKHAQTTGLNDRYLLMEKVFVFTARLKLGSTLQKKLEDALIGLLYDDLPHPPATFLGKRYNYRTADGSFNNVTIPELGKARTAYARTVQAKNPVPDYSLPDPSLVFDILLKRDGLMPHPSGVSSLMFAFANLIIHSIFKTDEKNYNINNTSSYLDLSPLYGDSEAAQKSIRQLDGRGMMCEDTFADQRLMMMPPSTPALLVMFCRNHNFIAQRILQINERGKYINPPPEKDPAALMTQDDDIFNKARLVNCSHFVNVILTDYLGAILGLTKEGNKWQLNPINAIRGMDRELVPRAQGNVVAVEFNLLYRWHATISVSDERWTEDLFRRMFPNKSWDSITVADFRARVDELRIGAAGGAGSVNPSTTGAEISNAATGSTYGESLGMTEPFPHRASRTTSSSSTKSDHGPHTWTFGGLKRDEKTGRFDDNALADILQNATETIAQAYRARGTPEVLRVVEILGIEQGRAWGVCTLNEFRQFIGLKAYESFEEWNPDPEIANGARALYGHIDRLELYVGMQAEEAKKPGPGAGLCPGYTISRTILADAVALTRGDRFLTTDCTPYNYTSWGYQDCSRDPDNGAFGSGLSKILLRGLPCNYTYNSVYSFFPFYTPATSRGTLNKLEIAQQYDFDRPKDAPPIVPVNTWEGVSQVLADPERFKITYTREIKKLTDGYGFFPGLDDPSKQVRDFKIVREALYPDEQTGRQYGKYFGFTTTKLINEKSCSLVGTRSRSVNIVQDILNVVPLHWVCNHLTGIPLKTPSTPHGVLTEQELAEMLRILYQYVFLDVQPLGGWKLQAEAEDYAQKLQVFIKTHIDGIQSNKPIISRLTSTLLTLFTGEESQELEILKRLAASRLPSDVLTHNIFGIMVAGTASFSMAASLVVNFYLKDEHEQEKRDIVKITQSDSPADHQRLVGYILEALRLDPQLPGVFRDVAADTEILEAGGTSTKVHKGQRLFVSLKNANKDSKIFGPDPDAIDPTRPIDKYNLFGEGLHASLARWFALHTLPQVIRSVFRLKNIRRAPGTSGKLNRFQQQVYGSTSTYLYVDSNGEVTPWATSMLIQYDS